MLKRGKSPFSQDNVLLASKAKINVFWKNFEWRVPEGYLEGRKNFQITLILGFVVIVQPPKHAFEIGFFFRILAYCVLFSKMCCFLRKFVVEKTMVFGNNPKYVCRCHPYYFIIVTKCMYLPPPFSSKDCGFFLGILQLGLSKMIDFSRRLY